MRQIASAADRLLVRILLDHDEGEPMGAYPSHVRIARLGGWSEGSVRNRILDLKKRGLITGAKIKGNGGYWSYSVRPSHVTSVGDLGAVIPVGDADANGVTITSSRRHHDGTQ